VLTVPEILDSIPTSRQEFAEAFLRAQDKIPIAKRKEFEAIGRSGDDRTAFEAALRYAEANQWLEDLVDVLVEVGRSGSALLLARMTELGSNDAKLQAIADSARGFGRPLEIIEGLTNGTRWACKILVKGKASGTGVLIARDLVLTAWHVVKELFEFDSGDWKATPGELRVEFDDLVVKVGKANVNSTPKRIDASEAWCTAFSACHIDELNSRFPARLEELTGLWDFAVIRLAKPLELDRGYAALDPRATVPRPGTRVYVFQYPAGGEQLIDEGEIVRSTPANQAIVPLVRFLHRANALHGSSGGPCFDRSFNLIGLHQGVWSDRDGGAINRGVPIRPIHAFLQKQPSAAPSSDAPIWEMPGTHEPIVGCDDFQGEVWASAVSGQKRIIVIGGDPASGKTFHAALAHAILSEVNHLKIELEAPPIAKMDAVTLANEISSKSGAEPLKILPVEEADTTVTAWLRNEVLQKLLFALDEIRGKRLVWITLFDLNRAEIEGKYASELLYLLYEQVKTSDWLRIVLDGMAGSVQAALAQQLLLYRIAPFTEAHIRTYVERALAARKVTIAAESIRIPIRTLGVAYVRALEQGQKDAIPKLVSEMKNLVEICSLPDGP
jgi:hypothetical protein